MFEHGHQYKRISPTQTKNPKRASKATRFSLHWTCTCDLHDTAPHNPRHLPISLLGASMHLTHISYPRQFDQRQFFFFFFLGSKIKDGSSTQRSGNSRPLHLPIISRHEPSRITPSQTTQFKAEPNPHARPSDL